jgi:hypothetical protein
MVSSANAEGGALLRSLRPARCLYFVTALAHARELAVLYPTDMQLRLLVIDLEKCQAH